LSHLYIGLFLMVIGLVPIMLSTNFGWPKTWFPRTERQLVSFLFVGIALVYVGMFVGFYR
jgi:hypothetical protein